MKKLILIVFIVMLLAVSAIVVYAQAAADNGNTVMLPLIFSQSSIYQPVAKEVCGEIPQVFELNDSAGNPVGQLSVRNFDHRIFVDYNLTGDWCMNSSNLEVAPSLEAIPQKNGSPLPDQFEFSSQSEQCIQQQSYEMPLTDERKFADQLYIAATAAIHNVKSGAQDDAWTTCLPFPANDGTGYCNYTVLLQDYKSFSLAVGFEDLMLTDVMDFDYNDWLTDLDGRVNYCRTIAERIGVTSVEFNISPEARGAALDHTFHLSIPPDTFLSDGVSTLNIFDQGGNVVSGFSNVPFVANEENDYTIIPLTSQAFPGSVVNTRESQPHVPTQRTAKLTIQFDELMPFNFQPSDPTLPENVHGANLLFDPYLFVLRTSVPSYGIHRGDDRMLILPSAALSWSEERIPVWVSYPDVTPGNLSVTPKVPPVFPGSWWLNSNDCVYNGVPCPVPPVTGFDSVPDPIASPVP